MFENKLGGSVSQIKDDVISLINLKLAYYELILTKRIIKGVSALIGNIIIAIFFILILVSLSFAFVAWYGSRFGSVHNGFLILSGAYVIIGFATYLLTKRFITGQMTKLLNERDSEDDDCLSTLKVPQDLAELDQQIEYIDLKVKKANVDIQYSFNKIGEMISLGRILSKVISASMTLKRISDFIMRFVNTEDKKDKNDGVDKGDEVIGNEESNDDK